MSSRAVRTWLGLVLVLTVLLGVSPNSMALPTGFSIETVANGLLSPTSMAFFPDGRIIVGQKHGVLLMIKNGAILPTPFIDISDHVNETYDRGFLSVTVDSAFPSQPYVYLYYTYENDPNDRDGTKTVRLTRVTVTGDTADPGTETVVLGANVGSSCFAFPVGSDCIASDSFSHSAGTVKSAPDGTLFITVGDGADFNTVDSVALRSQDLNSLNGKVLHVTRAGKGVPTNSFWTGNENDNRSKVWAYGLRNSYRANLRPGSDPPVVYAGDVGWGTWEEVNVVRAGSNMGWPCYEGSFQQAGYGAFQVCQDLYAGVTSSGTTLTSIGTPIARVTAPTGSGGPLSVIKDGDHPPVGSGDPSRQWDSYDGPGTAAEDWVGYSFVSQQTFDRVIFQEGLHFSDGGWFASGPTVQVRQSGQWVTVSGLNVTPAYPGNNGVSFETFTLTFSAIQGDAIRIYGVPGGSAAFITVGELEVFAPTGSGGGGTTPPVETSVTSQSQSIIARVTAPTGSGGPLSLLKDGDRPAVGAGDWWRQYDSYDGPDAATDDWVGYQFASTQNFTKVVFQEGLHFSDGGWFASGPTVQVRQSGQWVTVSGLNVTPAYPGNNGVNFETFTLTFSAIQGDAIRIYGVPGGSAAFISVGELDVFALVGGGSSPPPPSGPPVAATPPLVQYNHDGFSAAVTGGSFYTGTLYPPEYQGAYFYGDYAQSMIRTLRVDGTDALIAGSLTDFLVDAANPVEIQMGPDGRLYYVALGAAEIRRIQYTVGNTPPVAAASGNPTAGLGPLTVQFSSTGSNDPDGDPITLDWDFGDGSAPGTGPAPQHTYVADGTYVATLSVRDNHAGVTTATVGITVGNRPPVPTITSPAASFKYKVGDVVTYAGSATDPDQGALPASALTWQVVIHHCPGGDCHTHVYQNGTGAGGTVTVPDHGDDSYIEIILTAKDALGLTNTVSRSIQPQTLQLTLASSPTGLQAIYDGTSGTAPLVKTTIANSKHVIQVASPQGANAFQSWSDGGAQQHEVTLGTTNVTYTATFSGGGVTCPTGQYKAEYFSNVNLTGTPLITRCETTINNNWGTGGPGNGIPNDNFSVRWTGRFTFTAGNSTFTTVSDDGVRLWVDNVQIINRWTDHASTTDTATRAMTAGDHDVKLEYYEKAGGAVMQLSWTTNVSSCPVGQYRAEYFNNVGLTGTPLFTRCETAINNNWGTGGPGNGIGNDNFSVRWTGRFTFPAGSRTFTTVSDDGVRLWVDNVQIINRWTDHASTTDTATRTMTAGDHDVKLEYYEKAGGAVIQLSW